MRVSASASPPSALPKDESGQFVLDKLPAGAQQVETEAPRVALRFGRDALPAHELVAWLGARYRLRDVTFAEPQIEDVIRRVYEEGLLLAEVGACASGRRRARGTARGAVVVLAEPRCYAFIVGWSDSGRSG